MVRLFPRTDERRYLRGIHKRSPPAFQSHQSGDVLSTKKHVPAVLKSYVAVVDEGIARRLERYFKTGSGKAFAKKRFLNPTDFNDAQMIVAER